MQSLEQKQPTAPAAHDAKAEQILAAAREVFLELGYAATSMDQVAQQARVSKTTLYTRFPSKEELYTAVISAECERRGLRFAAEMFDGLPLREILVQVGRRFVDLVWSEAAIRVHQSVAGEATRMPLAAQLYFQAGPEQGIASFVALFTRLAERGVIATDDPAFVARQFLAVLQGGSYCQLVLGLCPRPTEEERYAFVDKAIDLFLHGVAPATR
ncbi:TetR/AcrR family transcriptional regulator [Azospirillum ramasamyi]|uniref:TetR/AcrR family transcriptional regulator n=1 Tax=Azospirillum ramasamyi TaxID=682998 RepID=A0A2U9SDN3_9PROT|nr:TetR/AcrR family transcriptional regulator [Azospirillum ramasamyi]AWU95998.1 TetR/AcrR family transcriptional regulator [Azospirillum ramasamyi]